MPPPGAIVLLRTRPKIFSADDCPLDKDVEAMIQHLALFPPMGMFADGLYVSTATDDDGNASSNNVLKRSRTGFKFLSYVYIIMTVQVAIHVAVA